MTEQHQGVSPGGWGVEEVVIIGAILTAFAVTWALYITSPPDGFVSPFGMIVSLVTGAFLASYAVIYLRTPL